MERFLTAHVPPMIREREREEVNHLERLQKALEMNVAISWLWVVYESFLFMLTVDLEREERKTQLINNFRKTSSSVLLRRRSPIELNLET